MLFNQKPIQRYCLKKQILSPSFLLAHGKYIAQTDERDKCQGVEKNLIWNERKNKKRET